MWWTSYGIHTLFMYIHFVHPVGAESLSYGSGSGNPTEIINITGNVSELLLFLVHYMYVHTYCSYKL